MLLRAVAEELGELRVTVDVDTPRLESIVVGWDQERWAKELLNPSGPSNSEPRTPDDHAHHTG